MRIQKKTNWFLQTETRRIWLSVAVISFLDIALISWTEIIAMMLESEYDRGVLIVLWVVLISVVNYVACVLKCSLDYNEDRTIIRTARQCGFVLGVAALVVMLAEIVVLSYLVLMFASVLTGYMLVTLLRMRNTVTLSDLQGRYRSRSRKVI